jgi:hypothetical protein
MAPPVYGFHNTGAGAPLDRSRIPAMLLAALLAGGPVGAAFAQPGPTPQYQGQPPLPPAPPERIEPIPRPAPGGGPTGKDIVDEQSGIPRGVVRPPAGVDPGIQAPVPVPAPNTTPVIPPPGTPGGDPSVQQR